MPEDTPFLSDEGQDTPPAASEETSDNANFDPDAEDVGEDEQDEERQEFEITRVNPETAEVETQTLSRDEWKSNSAALTANGWTVVEEDAEEDEYDPHGGEDEDVDREDYEPSPRPE